MGLKYAISSQIAENFPGVVIEPVSDGFDHLVGDFVEVRPLWQPAADHLVEVSLAWFPVWPPIPSTLPSSILPL